MYYEYSEIKTMLCSDLFKYFEDMTNSFGYRKPPFEMQPIAIYLFNSTYIMFCGAFENKLKTLRHLFGLISIDARRELFEKNANSVYKDDTLKKIYNIIENYKTYYNEESKIENKGIEDILYDVYKKYKCITCKRIIEKLSNIELFNCCKQEIDLFLYKFCDLEKEELRKIYNKAWIERHRIAHNLDFLYDNKLSLMRKQNSIVDDNYFIRLGIMECVDNYLIDSMNEIFNTRIYI